MRTVSLACVVWLIYLASFSLHAFADSSSSSSSPTDPNCSGLVPAAAAGAVPPEDPPPTDVGARAPREFNNAYPRIEGYEVIALIAGGGQSNVFLVRTPDRKYFIAKAYSRAEYAQREFRLLKKARKASHPGRHSLVEPHEVVDRFLILEQLSHPLTDMFGTNPLNLTTKTAALEIVDAMGAMHAAGLLHGDFKPGNIGLDKRGRIRVYDLGMAVKTGDPHVGSGTEGYTHPEQRLATADNPVVSTLEHDLYALRRTLQELYLRRRVNPLYISPASVLVEEDKPTDKELDRISTASFFPLGSTKEMHDFLVDNNVNAAYKNVIGKKIAEIYDRSPKEAAEWILHMHGCAGKYFLDNGLGMSMRRRRGIVRQLELMKDDLQTTPAQKAFIERATKSIE